MSARDAVLRAVKDALEGAPREPVSVPRDYRRQPERTADELLKLFVERVADYRAEAVVCPAGEAEAQIAQALPPKGLVAIPSGLPWAVPGAVEGDQLSHRVLDEFDAIVTAATIGIAETGTIVLQHGAGEGRRALSLVPDLHVCVVWADQLVADVPDAMTRLDPTRPTTWISGPSATSDIELNRVEGVHGPRTLHVIVVTNAPS